jgi:hypothetical protein
VGDGEDAVAHATSWALPHVGCPNIILGDFVGGRTVMAQPGAIDSKSNSYFMRHWRGELPLGQSFWQNGVVVGVVATVALLGVVQETLLMWWIIVGLVLEIPIIVWQLVGIWRSAGRYAGPRRWSILARVGAVIGTLYGVLIIELGTLTKLLERI